MRKRYYIYIDKCRDENYVCISVNDRFNNNNNIRDSNIINIYEELIININYDLRIRGYRFRKKEEDIDEIINIESYF